MKATRRHRSLFSALGVAVYVGAGSSALAATIPREPGDPFSVQLTEEVTRDDNLYRLPDGVDTADVMPGSNSSRDDLVSRTSAVVDGGWDFGKQAFALNANVDSNRYADNDTLDNVSGNGRADWNWKLGGDWSGQLGGGYGRSLAGFVNSRFLGKDLLETTDYHGAARYQLTPHWSLSAKTRLADASHDTEARKVDNFESQSNSFGAQYLTRRGDEFGLEYRHTSASFPKDVPTAGILVGGRDYTDRAATFDINYALTVKTSFKGSVGYLWRHYPQSVLGDFAGPVWNAALQWEPRSRTRIVISQWKELKAYLDAESNHFESRGTRVTGTWLPTNKITLSLDISREKNDYTGFDPTSFTEPPRQDTLRTGQAVLSYAPVQRLSFDVTYRFEQRDTNRTLFDYDDRVISVGVTFIF